MILTTCKYFDLVGNRCSRVTDGKCNDLQDCEFKYIAELKAENERLKARVKEIGEKMSFLNADRCSEIMRYKQTLQEIKEIAERQMRCCTCKLDDYKSGCKECESKYAREIAVEILQKINKAEEE